jgi:hypothetical protein
LANGFEHKSESPQAIDTGPNPIIDILVYSTIEGTAPLLVKRKWNQNFRDIRKAWIQRQAELPDKVKGEIYFTWRDKKVWDVGSCKSIGIKLDQYGNAQIPSDQGPYKDSNDRVVLCATTDEQLKAERAAQAEAQKKKEQQQQEEEPEALEVQPPPSKQIRVILKAKGYVDQKLIVKPVSRTQMSHSLRFAHFFFRTHQSSGSRALSADITRFLKLRAWCLWLMARTYGQK